jgi:hypothetical protein
MANVDVHIDAVLSPTSSYFYLGPIERKKVRCLGKISTIG